METRILRRIANKKPAAALLAGLFVALVASRARSLAQMNPNTLTVLHAETSSNQFHLLESNVIVGLAATPLDSAFAYPVPYEPTRGHTAINFSSLTDGATVKIYTIVGELVKELSVPAGATSVQWDVRNGEGSDVASGVYLYQVKNDRFEKHGKLMIIR